MIKRAAPLLLSGSLLGACSLFGSGPAPRIATLDSKPPPPAEMPVPLEISPAAAARRYQELLALSPAPEQRATAKRRLAELELTAVDREYQDNGATAAESKLAAVISRYEDYLQDYPNHTGNDRVLYHLAQAYTLAGRHDQALATLDRLATQHPGSALLAEVQFRRGEALFARGAYARAAAAYQAVVDQGGDGNAYFEQALFKLGWSRFKLTDHGGAVDAYLMLLDRKFARDEFATGTLGNADSTLTELLRSISLAFYYQQGPASVRDYFARHAPRPYQARLYAALGDYYLGKERYSDAVASYRAFVEHHPTHPLAPLLQVKLIEALKDAGFATDARKARAAYTAAYGPGGAFWARYGGAGAPAAAEFLKSYLDSANRRAHARAQKSGRKEDYQSAIAGYRRYLEAFPQATESAAVNFLLAEALHDSGAYAEALAEYERTAYGYPDHPRAAEAAYAAVLAYDEVARHESPRDALAWRRQALLNAERFVATFPTHPQAAAVTARLATQWYRSGNTALARRAAFSLLARADTDPERQRLSLSILAHSAFDTGDFVAAESYYHGALLLTPPDHNALGPTRERLAAAIYQQGAARQNEQDWAGAAATFLRVARLTPGLALAATADYDAATALMQAESWSQAATVLQGFRRRYPAHPLQGDVTRKLAVTLQNAGEAAAAAAEFERLSHASKDVAEQREALLQAAELYAKARDASARIRTLKSYVERFPEPVPAAIEARQQLAEAFAAGGDQKQQRTWLKALAAAHDAAGPAATSRTRYLAARAALTLAEDTLVPFHDIKLVEPLRKNLKRKKQAMQAALAAYQRAAAYQVAEVMPQATYRIAELYHSFSRELMDSERPAGLSELEQEQYDILLEEQAIPFEDQAIDTYEANAALARQGVYDKWVEKSFAQLSRLFPARYAKVERGEEAVTRLR